MGQESFALCVLVPELCLVILGASRCWCVSYKNCTSFGCANCKFGMQWCSYC